MDDFAAVPKVLYSWIDDQNPYKTAMLYQIKYWWKTFSDLCRRDPKGQLVRVISRKDCWIKVENLHGFVLDGYKVCKLLIKESKTNVSKTFIFACRCCLEEDINIIYTKRYNPRCTYWKPLMNYISHNISGYEAMLTFWLEHRVEILNIDNLPVFKHGLNTAIETNQLFALKYFWDKINTLSVYRITSNVKDGMIMEYACKALKLREPPAEIFEFFFSQMNPNQYAQLLKMDLKINRCCKIVPALLKTLRFEDAGMFFNLLEPSDVTADSYRDWLKLFQFQHFSGQYLNVAMSVFGHMYSESRIAIHRSNVEVIEELTDAKKRMLNKLSENHQKLHELKETQKLSYVKRVRRSTL